ncbi:MAG: GNAT family N-acetyltransferase [Burkholderiales bacterium]
MTAADIEVIADPNALQRLTSDWHDLWNRCSTATPFQSPDWLLAWWKHFGHGRLHVLALRRESRIVALAPFFVTLDRHTHTRKLLLIGTGVTDYLDVLVEDGRARTASQAFFKHLATAGGEWDECDFQELRTCSLLLERDADSGYAAKVEAQQRCPVLSLPTYAADLKRCMSPRLYKNFHRYPRTMARHGRVQIDHADDGSFEELMSALIGLHQARWTNRGMHGVLCDPNVQQFHRAAARGLLSRGALRLYALRLDGRIIGGYYGFHHAGRAYAYLGGFDPEFEKYSPGTVLIGHAIEEAIGEHAREFDFLRGCEAYKYAWGASDRVNYRKTLTNVKTAVRPTC